MTKAELDANKKKDAEKEQDTLSKAIVTKKSSSSDPGGSASSIARTLGGIILCLFPFIISTSTPTTLLEKIKADGFLRVTSLNGPSTVYEGRFGHAGFEYELTKAFAEKLNVELAMSTEQGLNEILSQISTTDYHFAAAGLSIIEERKKDIDFSIPYSTVTQQVIYRRGEKKPKTVSDLIGKKIVVASKSSHARNLNKLKVEYPNLNWTEKVNVEMPELLNMVHNGEANITIVDSSAFVSNRAIYPKARSAFNFAKPEGIAWGFPKRKDKSLLNAANTFLQQYIDSGKLAKLEKKYFEKPLVDEVSALAFSKRIEERLPQWIDLFKAASKEYDLDWLFLAAMSYQESLWNKNAKSFTGVRGLMMLTNRTAKELGVKDRTDPQQSILGGARYFSQIRRRIPKGISEPDRTWMALASYNVGFGHLEDARVLTQSQGGNPNIWKDVKERLPLLAIKKYYRGTRHGYARGWEPVRYVENIRNYHRILIWYFSNKAKERITSEKE